MGRPVGEAGPGDSGREKQRWAEVERRSSKPVRMPIAAYASVAQGGSMTPQVAVRSSLAWLIQDPDLTHADPPTRLLIARALDRREGAPPSASPQR